MGKRGSGSKNTRPVGVAVEEVFNMINSHLRNAWVNGKGSTDVTSQNKSILSVNCSLGSWLRVRINPHGELNHNSLIEANISASNKMWEI